MGIFSGKVTVVTGASRGLGKPIAIELAEAGARLACVATRAENAAETVARDQESGGRGERLRLPCRAGGRGYALVWRSGGAARAG